MTRLAGIGIGIVGLVLFLVVAGPVQEYTFLGQRATVALDRYADAVAAAGTSPPFAIVSDRTRQIGSWELEVGGVNKVALLSGVIESRIPLPTTSPGTGVVTWSNGRTDTVRLVSAAEALAQIRADGAQPCPDCRPLVVTSATLVRQPTETSLGTADVPVWEFALEGSAVLVSRVALAARADVDVAPMEPSGGRYIIPIQSAASWSDGRRLTVKFIGGPGPGEGGYTVDYWADAVESATAVAVVVRQIPSITDLLPKTAEGHFRSAEVELQAPIADRAVLEISRGLPVRLEPASG